MGIEGITKGGIIVGKIIKNEAAQESFNQLKNGFLYRVKKHMDFLKDYRYKGVKRQIFGGSLTLLGGLGIAMNVAVKTGILAAIGLGGIAAPAIPIAGLVLTIVAGIGIIFHGIHAEQRSGNANVSIRESLKTAFLGGFAKIYSFFKPNWDKEVKNNENLANIREFLLEIEKFSPENLLASMKSKEGNLKDILDSFTETLSHPTTRDEITKIIKKSLLTAGLSESIVDNLLKTTDSNKGIAKLIEGIKQLPENPKELLEALNLNGLDLQEITSHSKDAIKKLTEITSKLNTDNQKLVEQIISQYFINSNNRTIDNFIAHIQYICKCKNEVTTYVEDFNTINNNIIEKLNEFVKKYPTDRQNFIQTLRNEEQDAAANFLEKLLEKKLEEESLKNIIEKIEAINNFKNSHNFIDFNFINEKTIPFEDISKVFADKNEILNTIKQELSQCQGLKEILSKEDGFSKLINIIAILDNKEKLSSTFCKEALKLEIKKQLQPLQENIEKLNMFLNGITLTPNNLQINLDETLDKLFNSNQTELNFDQLKKEILIEISNKKAELTSTIEDLINQIAEEGVNQLTTRIIQKK